MYYKMTGALNVLRSYTTSHPELPAPYIVLDHDDPGTSISILVWSLSDFEAWREALEIESDLVEISGFDGREWLSVHEGDFAPDLSIRITSRDLTKE